MHEFTRCLMSHHRYCLYSRWDKLSIPTISWSFTLSRIPGGLTIVEVSTNFSRVPSEPPETHVDDERDEEHRNSSHFGVRGAGVEVFGVAAILLRQGREIAGFRVES